MKAKLFNDKLYWNLTNLWIRIVFDMHFGNTYWKYIFMKYQRFDLNALFCPMQASIMESMTLAIYSRIVNFKDSEIV